MRKRYDGKEADRKFRQRVTRNWIICAVSLVLIIVCYYFV